MSNRDDRYITHHKALYLQRLVTMPGFPAGYLHDRDFRNATVDLLPPPAIRELDRAEAMMDGDKLSVSRAVKRFGGAAAYAVDRPARRLSTIDRLAVELGHTATHTARNPESAPLALKLARVTEVFALDAVEEALVRFFALCQMDPALGTVMQDHTLTVVQRNYPRFLGRLLDLAPNKVAHRLSPQSQLMKRRILDGEGPGPRSNGSPELAPALQRIFTDQRVKPERLVDAFYAREPQPSLSGDDFAHLKIELDRAARVLMDAWQGRRRGTNLLLYGPPGLGKTEFARLAAKIGGGQAFAVPRADEQGNTPSPSERRMAYDAFQRLCQGETNPVLIVDEAESVLEESIFARLFGRRGGSEGLDTKAWLTQALESNPLPVIWIANNERGIDPAVRRRFTMSIHFPELPPRVLERVWNHALSKAGRHFRLDAPVVRDLVTAFDLAPGSIAQAVDTWKRVTGAANPELPELRRVLGQSQRLITGEDPNQEKLRALDSRYDPAVVSLTGDFDVKRLGEALAAFCARASDGAVNAQAVSQLTFLFYGPSGAGKTELAKHLARHCGRRLQVERMSDLLSMWVGESEQNIAAAFKRAASKGSILLLDEFDSLAYDRKNATKSWEISQTNELLQQIENFPGVLIACTNLLENLDQAISRRFSHKVGFQGIPAEKRAEATELYFADVLGGQGLDGGQGERLRTLAALFPGDLRAVRQRFTADVLRGEALRADQIVAALEHEASFRKTERKIGFTVNG
jgi:AAA+ superfamily predicted ATPase